MEFLAGFFVALLTAVTVLAVLYKKRKFRLKSEKKQHFREFEELGKLTGQLAHEIKNPLSTIKINLGLVSEELEELAKAGIGEAGSNLPEKSSQRYHRPGRKISIIQKEADRLEQILDEFLGYLDRGDLQLASVDLNELVSDMVDFYSPQAYSHNMKVRQGLYAGELVCRVDAGMLKQVLLNLFINAQEAVGEAGELIVRTDKRQQNAVIEVSDTGRGIAEDKLTHIFDPYYSSKSGGSGLGLPTAKKIIERHGGELSVNSVVGKGTSFLIKLPV